MDDENPPGAARQEHALKAVVVSAAETEREIALAWAEVTSLIVRDCFVGASEEFGKSASHWRIDAPPPPVATPEDRGDRDAGLKVARALADGGEYGNWQAVRAEMVGLGYGDATIWFADPNVQNSIGALCEANSKSRLVKRG